MRHLDRKRIILFQRKIWGYYRGHKRDLPWRPPTLKLWHGKADPYQIWISEVMLQQTQVSRVLLKYPEFLRVFPTVQRLAKGPLSKVLKVWQGLGYNRRALMLQRAAKVIVNEFGGTLPPSITELSGLPGIGPSTAAGIMNFAFAVPTPYLETNVRSVYLHYFFAKKKDVRDQEIIEIMLKMFPKGGVPRGAKPSTWFYALLDYGVMLKKSHGNPNKRSAHYAKQSPFEGSRRQARARLLRRALKAGVGHRHLLRLLS